MLVSRSLGQNQHLKCLTLGVRIGNGVRLVQQLVVRGPSEQPFDTALHPTISHRTTSLRERSYASTSASPTPRLGAIGSTDIVLVGTGVRAGAHALSGGMVPSRARIVRVENPNTRSEDHQGLG